MTGGCLHHDITIDVEHIRQNYLCDDVRTILKGIHPEWFTESIEHRIKSKVFSGGISNQLYGYYLDQLTEDAVLIRIYGVGTEHFTDRPLGNKIIMMLHERGLGPPLYATFNNGSVYGYVPGKTLDNDSLRKPHIRKLIAEEIVKIQSVTLDDRDRKPALWDRMWTFWENGPDSSVNNPEQNDKLWASIPPKHVLLQEMNATRAHLEHVDSQIVFCHNDLVTHNIVYNKDNETVTFIDYEFAMYNPEHYELGNHFNEYAGLEDLDFSRIPDKAYQIDWLRHYLQQKAKCQGRSPNDVTDCDVERCYVLTNKFTLIRQEDV
ncbi:ethanolamine kinase 2-like isoform X2 [Mya arenaria]|uniref:ethanolamine kinase 2-like isoform X2 n=1 Tax=Mya arenaria TaxID=6604 RepID=UPI0022E78429|nr:ethanolamine kinase 2-like isoform X2 [Mya arenaria]